MPTEVTDPALLAQLNGVPAGPREVTDPALLAQLNGGTASVPVDNSLGRQLGLTGRAVINGLTGIPQMAADAGIAARNLMTGHYDPTNWRTLLFGSQKAAQEGATPSFSGQFNQSLTQAGLPEPKSWQEKTAGIVEGALAGSRVPVPQAAEQAPANFVRPADMERQVLANTVKKGQDLGLVVPPATTNRSGTNMTLETIAGKLSTQQNAAAHNQGTINQIAKEAVGLNEDAPLTQEGLAAIRQEASQAGYEPIRAAGTIQAPPSLHERLVAALSKYQGAERSFPGMGKTELSDIVAKVDRPNFDAGDAIDLTKILRDKASTAFRAGDSGTGQGLREIDRAVEDSIEQGLQAKGPQFADAVQAFRQARQTIAKTYTVEDAFNPGTGNVVASKLAAALKKGTPLSGPLRDVAKFAAAVPKAVQEPTTSMGVNHLDMYAPMTTMLFGHGLAEKAAGLAVPASRWAARSYLLSPMGQAGALPSIAQPATGRLPMAFIGATSAQ